MFLQSICIENFQQYQHKFELKGLTNGLNIIYGNNEAGKSTLLRALRAVLFDRFNGKAGEDYSGYRGGAPEVTIEFKFQNKFYCLEKIFSKKKEGRAILTDEKGQQWIATEAEAHLTNLLNFEAVERGLTKVEQQGIYGILWVEQGRAWEQIKLANNKQAKVLIQDVLSSELTNMLSQGRGDALLTIFSTELKKYQTEKTGKPTGELKLKIEQIELKEKKLEHLQAELIHHQTKVDKTK